MKKLFTLVCILLAHVSFAQNVQTLYNLYDRYRDVEIKENGDIQIRDRAPYQMILTSKDQRKYVQLTPKNSNDHARSTIYFKQGPDGMESSITRYKSSGITLYTNYKDYSTPEYVDGEGKKINSINFGKFTLICSDNTLPTKNPSQDRICVVANEANCKNMEGSSANLRKSFSREDFQKCSTFLNAIFSNQETALVSAGVPQSLFFAEVSNQVANMTGDSLRFNLYNSKSVDDMGFGKFLDYVSVYYNTCQAYLPQDSSTGRANGNSSTGGR